MPDPQRNLQTARRWPVCIAALLVFGAFATAVCSRQEWVIRWSGGFLQLLGIAGVFWGIHETRRFFGQRSWLDHLLSALAPSDKTRTIMEAKGEAFGTSGADAAITLLRAQTPKTAQPTTEERLISLEQNLSHTIEALGK